MRKWKPYRSSHQRCSIKKGVFRNFAKFTEKHLCQSLFFSKVAGRPATLLKKRLWHRCFPKNIAKFLRISKTFLQNTPGRLLLALESFVRFVSTKSFSILNRELIFQFKIKKLYLFFFLMIYSSYFPVSIDDLSFPVPVLWQTSLILWMLILHLGCAL